jgi:predicted RNA-binding Zn-ribbon protein involved in translation (DUF1610 family)
MTDIISEIERLPHFRPVKCTECSTEIRVQALQIYAECPKCGFRHKCRGFAAIGGEVQDVIDAVLAWAGEEESFDAVMRRRQEILADERQ